MTTTYISSSLSDGIHPAFNDPAHSVYLEKLANGNFGFTGVSYDKKSLEVSFVEVSEGKYGKDSSLRVVLRKMGFNPLYLYVCDSQGRVKGDRLPTSALIRDYDRVLAVGQYEDHFFHISHN